MSYTLLLPEYATTRVAKLFSSDAYWNSLRTVAESLAGWGLSGALVATSCQSTLFDDFYSGVRDVFAEVDVRNVGVCMYPIANLSVAAVTERMLYSARVTGPIIIASSNSSIKARAPHRKNFVALSSFARDGVRKTHIQLLPREHDFFSNRSYVRNIGIYGFDDASTYRLASSRLPSVGSLADDVCIVTQNLVYAGIDVEIVWAEN